MLTSKVIHADGTEEVFSVASVKLCGKTAPSVVVFDRASNGLVQVGAGQVFVMNDGGKTVAKYDLGAPANEPRSFFAVTAGTANAAISTISNS